ncbi:MAG: sensor histidine kinase, partial [Abiotrophia defectiva]
MRFRFLWQLIAGFLLVMLVTLALSASRISNYMNQQIHSEVETRLLNYGSNIVSNNFSREDIKKVDQLLASDNISIQVYLANGSIIYPT